MWHGIKGKIRLLFGFVVLVLVIQVVGIGSRDMEMRGRRWVGETAQGVFTGAARLSGELYGLKSLDPNQGEASHAASNPLVLIHGLDEPGLVWNQLIPALEAAGYWVLTFTYPNDQEVGKSSAFLLSELKGYSLFRGQRLTLIAHSMGGLVARNMLTDPNLGYEDLELEGAVPGVERLIMVGTPNHGSQMARFRFVTEIRDQYHQWRHGNVSLVHGLMDGAGEAGIDLLPGSRFLNGLNLRPHPQGVRYDLIAGVFIPWYMEEIKDTLGMGGDGVGGLSRQSGAFRQKVVGVTALLGDGLVPVSSVMLDHFSLTLVPGGHLDMIRNYPWQSRRTPPGVPVILDLLETKSQ